MNFDLVKDRFKRNIDEIFVAAVRNRVDPLLIAAICWQESEFDPFSFRFELAYQSMYINPMSIKKIHELNPAMAKTGLPSERTERTALATSWGMMQVIGQTARELGFRGQYLTELCGSAGIQYGALNLRKQLDRYNGNVEQAISAYNAGTATPKNRKSYVVPVMEKITMIQDSGIFKHDQERTKNDKL